jgi:hypothetical protein
MVLTGFAGAAAAEAAIEASGRACISGGGCVAREYGEAEEARYMLPAAAEAL